MLRSLCIVQFFMMIFSVYSSNSSILKAIRNNDIDLVKYRLRAETYTPQDAQIALTASQEQLDALVPWATVLAYGFLLLLLALAACIIYALCQRRVRKQFFLKYMLVLACGVLITLGAEYLLVRGTSVQIFNLIFTHFSAVYDENWRPIVPISPAYTLEILPRVP